MFDFLSWGHLLVIGLAALFIFGPERLPTLAADAGRGVRPLRGAITAIRAQMAVELSEDLPDIRELDVHQYQPRTFLRSQLFGDDPAHAAQAARPPDSFLSAAVEAGDRDRPPSVVGGPPGVRLAPPPFDLDAT